MFPTAKVSIPTAKAIALNVLKHLGTNIAFPKPSKGAHTVSITLFEDAGRLLYHVKPPYISGLLIGTTALD